MSTAPRLPLRPFRRRRSLAVRAVVVVLVTAVALVCFSFAGDLFARPEVTRPTEQSLVPATVVSAPAELPTWYGPAPDSEGWEDAPATAAAVELDDPARVVVVYGLDPVLRPGDRVELHRLDEDVPVNAVHFTVYPRGVAGDGQGALSVLPFPDRDLAGDVSYDRLGYAAMLGALGLWLLGLAASVLVSIVLVSIGRVDGGPELRRIRAEGLLLDPDAGPLEWSRATSRLESPWTFLVPLSHVCLALGGALAAFAFAIEGVMDGLDFGVLWVALGTTAAGVVLVSAQRLVVRWVLRLRARLLLPTVPLLLPAWLLLTPAGARHRRRLRRRLGPVGFETALTLAGEQAISVEELSLLAEALEPLPARP